MPWRAHGVSCAMRLAFHVFRSRCAPRSRYVSFNRSENFYMQRRSLLRASGAAALLARWESHPKVDLITTDGFLLRTAEM